MEIKEALSTLIKDVVEINEQAIMNIHKTGTSIESVCYNRGRYEVSKYVKEELLNIIKMIPTQQINYYILKETDNIEDILKGVSNELHS